MPYRTELRRPDLKGTFRCSLCNKIFCHSSSLSRHRMQAHFKSYTCTLCNKEITSNETLRAHMYKKHQISRMFMCRCCNWAFPDKTSLHIHMQAMATGSPGNVSIIAKSCPSPPLCPSSMVDTSPDGSMGGIFPAMPTRDVISRLREQSMAKNFQGAPSGLDLSSLFPAFTKFLPAANRGTGRRFADADGVSFSNGKFTDRDESTADSESLPDDSVEMKCEFDEPMDESDMMENDDERKESKSGASSPNRPSSSPQSPPKDQNQCSTSKGSDSEHQTDAATNEMIMNGAGINPLYMDPSGQADLPILRSAISASPLNSLLYQKKLNNALRNKAQKHITSSPLLTSGFSSLMYATKPFTDHLFAAAAAAGYPTNGFLQGMHPLFGACLSDKEELSPELNSSAQNWTAQQIPTEAPSPAESPASAGSVNNNNNNSSNGRCIFPSSTTASKSPIPVTNNGGGNNKEQCFDCHLMKGRVAQAENRCRFLESKTTSQESKISRLETRIGTLEANNRRYENETHLLRDHCDKLERRILDCQELALRYLQGQHFEPEATGKMLLEILESCCVYK